MAQWAQASAAKPGNLDLISRPHIIEGEKHKQNVLWPQHEHCGTHSIPLPTPAHPYTQIPIIKAFYKIKLKENLKCKTPPNGKGQNRQSGIKAKILWKFPNQ